MEEQEIYLAMNESLQDIVLDDIKKERTRQFMLHGEQRDIDLPMLFCILSEEHGEVAQAIQAHYQLDNVKETDQDNLYKELIHVAAVAVKMAERVKLNESNRKTTTTSSI